MMDEYSICYPMQAPLLESTAVNSEVPSHNPVDIQSKESKSHCSSLPFGGKENSKLDLSLERSNTVGKSSRSSNKDDNTHEMDLYCTHSISHITKSEATEQLGATRDCSLGPLDMNDTESDNSIERDSLDTSTSSQYKSNSVTYQAKIFVNEDDGERTIKTEGLVPDVSVNTGTESSTETRDIIAQPPVESFSPVLPRMSAIMRYRFNPLTNTFEEVTPAAANIRLHESFSSSSSSSPSSPVTANLDNSAAHHHEEIKSPWELWLLRKTREKLEQQKLLKNELLQKEREEVRLRDLKSKKLKQAAAIHQEWVQKKTAEERFLRRAREEARRRQQEDELKKRQMIQTKASASYMEWKKKKEEEEEQVKEKTRAQVKVKEQEQRRLREDADHAYKVWLRTVGCKKVNKELLYPDTRRNYVFSHPDKNRLRKWHFY